MESDMRLHLREKHRKGSVKNLPQGLGFDMDYRVGLS
jgi:hypothetical protein